MHKPSQISTTSMHSAKINLPKETDYEIWVSNEEQYILELPSQRRGELINGNQDQWTLPCKRRCWLKIPVLQQEPLQPKFWRTVIFWSCWHWMDYHTKFWNTCSRSNLKLIRNNCVWLLENVVKFNPHPNATWAVRTGNCSVLLWVTSALTLSSNCYNSWKLKQN